MMRARPAGSDRPAAPEETETGDEAGRGGREGGHVSGSRQDEGHHLGVVALRRSRYLAARWSRSTSPA